MVYILEGLGLDLFISLVCFPGIILRPRFHVVAFHPNSGKKHLFPAALTSPGIPSIKLVPGTSYYSFCLLSCPSSHLTLQLSLGDYICIYSFNHHLPTHDSHIQLWSSCSVPEPQTYMSKGLLKYLWHFPKVPRYGEGLVVQTVICSIPRVDVELLRV